MRASCLALAVLTLGSLTASPVWAGPATAANGKAKVSVPSNEPKANSFHFNGKSEKVVRSDNGPGLVVCDPILKNCGDELADISRGCAAWLQLVVAGQPQCSRTPFWKSLRRVQLELGRRDLRLDKKKR